MKQPIEWDFFGASARGPSHTRAGLKSQDSWLGRRYQSGTLIVVCDGLGSRPYSREGSMAGCRAVAHAFRIWTRARGASVERLIRLVHAIWPLYINPREPGDCATTCQFAGVDQDGRLIVAQLGDGMALVEGAEGVSSILTPDKSRGFANETTGLGLATSMEEWRWSIEPDPAKGSRVLLATDGIADDLDPARLPEVAGFVQRRYADLAPRARWQALNGHLRDWPVPHHADDKTLAILWSH